MSLTVMSLLSGIRIGTKKQIGPSWERFFCSPLRRIKDEQITSLLSASLCLLRDPLEIWWGRFPFSLNGKLRCRLPTTNNVATWMALWITRFGMATKRTWRWTSSWLRQSPMGKLAKGGTSFSYIWVCLLHALFGYLLTLSSLFSNGTLCPPRCRSQGLRHWWSGVWWLRIPFCFHQAQFCGMNPLWNQHSYYLC